MATRPQRIFDVLKRATKPMTAREVADILDERPNSVSSDLSRMVRQVRVVGVDYRGKGKPQRLFVIRPGAYRPDDRHPGVIPSNPIVTTPAPPQRAIPAVPTRKIVVVDGREMEVAWP